jgi:hypothetical protein
MKVRLTKKLAERLDGVDLSNCAVGDLMDLPDEKARLLVAEGWAAPERRSWGTGGLPAVLAFRRYRDPGQLEHDDEISRAS